MCGHRLTPRGRDHTFCFLNQYPFWGRTVFSWTESAMLLYLEVDRKVQDKEMFDFGETRFRVQEIPTELYF